MWVIAVKERGEFEGLREHLEAKRKTIFEKVTTATGGEIYCAPQDSSGPHIIKVPEQLSKLYALAQWLHRSLRFSAIISSGVLRPLNKNLIPLPQTEDGLFIPDLCCRSAGRLDMGSSPILYQEISFDREIQHQIVQNALRRPLIDPGRLCSGDRVPNDPEVLNWICSELRCQSMDSFTSELQLIGKRFGTPIGCLKVWENAKDPVQKLVEAWTSIIV